MKTTFKVIFALLFTVVIAIIGVFTWAVKNPQSAFQLVEKYVMPEDMKVTWKDMDINIKYLSGLNFYVDWNVADLSIQKEKPFMDFQIDKVRLESSIFPLSNGHKIEAHQWIVLAEKTMRFRPSKQEQKPKEEKNPFETFKGFIDLIGTYQKYVEMNVLEFSVREFKLLQEGDNSIDVRILARQNQAEAPYQLSHDITINMQSTNPMTVALNGDFFLNAPGTDTIRLVSALSVTGSGVTTKQNIEMDYRDNTASLSSTGPVTFKKDKLGLTATPMMQLTMTESGADLALSSKIVGIPGKNIRINTFEVRIHSPFDKGTSLSEKPTDFSVTAPLDIYFVDKDMERPFTKECQCRVPEVVRADLKGKAWLKTLTSTSDDRKKAIEADLKLDDVANKLLSINAAAFVRVDKQGKEFLYQPQINARATIHSFQGLKNFLYSKNILVPAPLDVLEGQIHLVMEGPVETSKEAYVFPSVTTLKLASKNQQVDIETKARLRLKPNFKAMHVDIQALINELQLELPPLDPVRGKPRVTPDGRILASAPKPKKPSDFKLTTNLQVQTARPGSIRLLSEYFKPYLPVTAQVRQSESKTNSGFVKLEPFDVEYLRRTVHVEKMRVDLSEANKKFFVVDGRLRIKQTQYTIFIDVQGPSNKPQITLSSDPYLPRSEIISVLIYDRTSDQLASTDAKTAGNVEAAVVDRAIGLFGIWAFASTPIRGFSYNPATQVYTATLALSDDVSASVGTNWEEAAHVELRKRISNRWMLTAAWSPAGPDQEEITKLVLQWENRF